MLKVAESGADHGTQPVKFRFLRGDPRHEVVHTLFGSSLTHMGKASSSLPAIR